MEATKELQITLTISPENQAEIEEMISDLLSSSDIFNTGHSGTWARGILNGADFDRPDYGWLLWEDGELEDELNAIAAFRDGTDLPEHYYRLNRSTATKIVHLGIFTHGIGFVQGDADAGMVDAILQTVLLGDLVYC